MADEPETQSPAAGSRYASRKFLLAVLIIAGAGIMNIMGIKPDPTLAELVKWVAGLYFAGNVAQRYVASKAP